MPNETVGSSVGGAVAGTTGQSSVGQARGVWLEVMYYLSCFFGVLYLAGVLGQVAGMVAHTAFKTELGVKLTSSVLMGNLYLTFLAAYVGPKEFVRWMKKTDDEILSPIENKMITRGAVIVAGWAVLTGIAALFQQMSWITEVPETLLYTLSEVVALFCGTEVSKFLRVQAAQTKKDAVTHANFGDRAVAYAKEHDGIGNEECQKEFGLTKGQAYRLLNRLAKAGQLKTAGAGKATRYLLP